MNMKHRNDDDEIKREQESALGRILKQEPSTSTGRGKKIDSRGDLFAQLAEQFVHQVKAMASIDEKFKKEAKKEQQYDDDDVILIEADNSEPISKSENDNRIVERTVRLSGIPNRAASRVAQVLKHEFGITAFKPERHEEDGDQKERGDTLLSKSRAFGLKLKSSALHASLPPSDAQTKVKPESITFQIPSNQSKLTPPFAGPTNDQPPTVLSTIAQCSLECMDASEPVATSFHQLTPVMPQTSSSSVVRESEMSASCESAPSSPSLAARATSSSADRNSEEPEPAGFEPACSSSTDAFSESENDEAAPSLSRPEASDAARSSAASQKDASDSRIKDLTAEVVDRIHRNSASTTSFAINLMRHLFHKSEIVVARNVFGQTRFTKAKSLDQKRILLIRRLVREKLGSEYTTAVWSKCVHYMSATVCRIARNHQRKIRLGATGATELYPKTSTDLEESDLYVQSDLSFKKINAAYRRSKSYPDFAKQLLQLLFKRSELRVCHSVYGRNDDQTVDADRALDPKRIQIMRHIIEENSNFCDELWKECVRAMNVSISWIKRQSKK